MSSRRDALTLGVGLLNQLRAVRDTTGDYNQLGILALQANQYFNAALKIDPKNWKAQFLKSAATYHWTANSQSDNQVVQQLHLRFFACRFAQSLEKHAVWIVQHLTN